MIDLTNTACNAVAEDQSSSGVYELPKEIRLFTPIFTTPTNLRKHKECRKQLYSPIFPGIVFPFELNSYQFPCDLGTYLFWQNYCSVGVTLDCQKMRFHNGQDLLELCSASSAASYLVDLVAPLNDS